MIAGEEALRQRIMAALAERAAHNGGVVSRAELSAFPVAPGEQRRLIDQSRGIWNPRDLDVTLTIISSPDGPYADHEIRGLRRHSPQTVRHRARREPALSA